MPPERQVDVILRKLVPSISLIALFACSSNGENQTTEAAGTGGGAATASGSGGGGASGSGGGGASGSGSGSGSGGGSACDPAAGTYFVSPGGNDSNPGSLDKPFATINHALDLAMPGDTVVVGKGTYAELVVFPRSGEASAPITLRAACGERPILDGTGLGADVGEPALVSITDQSFLVVDGFEMRNLQGKAGNFPAGVWVRGASHDIEIRNNVIHDIVAENGGDSSGAHGIGVYGLSKTPTERIHIAENELHHLVLGWSEGLAVNGNVRDFEVRDNIIHDANNIGFVFIGFEPDVCTSCAQDDLLDTADVNRARNGLITGNTAYNVSSYGNPAYGNNKSAGCFYVDGGGGLVIERNVAYGCDLGVEIASEWYGKSARDVVLRNNFLYANDVTCISTGGYDAGMSAGGGAAKNILVVNNTLSDCSRAGWADAGILLQNRNQGNVYQNNIIVPSAGTSAVVDGGSMNSSNVFDYNIYFGGALDGVMGGTHSLTADPKLVDAAMGDLHVAPGSPAKDAGNEGVNVGATDFDGDPRKNGAVDIGADEL